MSKRNFVLATWIAVPSFVDHFATMDWQLVGWLLLVLVRVGVTGFVPFSFNSGLVQPLKSRHCVQRKRSDCRSSNTPAPQEISDGRIAGIPLGRVIDMDSWVELSSKCLYQQTGKSMFDRMEGVENAQQVHRSTRYAVLSHGIQDDPIYCYFNEGALLTFQWSESEIYQLPSRYSAPEGTARDDRAVYIRKSAQDDIHVIPRAIRQTKSGELFEIDNVILWNVYNDGVRLGQTALFDRELVRAVKKEG